MEEKLSSTITNARKKAGISQRELARRVNMDCAEVSRIEAGKRLKPNVLYLKGIAENLKLNLIDLMKMAGYDEIDINKAYSFSEKGATTNYQKQIERYRLSYMNALTLIEERRKIDLTCKELIDDLIKKTSDEKTKKELTKIIETLTPNLEIISKRENSQIYADLISKEKQHN